MSRQLIAPALWEYDSLDEAIADAKQYADKAPGSRIGWGTTYVVQQGATYYGPLTNIRIRDWGFAHLPIVFASKEEER